MIRPAISGPAAAACPAARSSATVEMSTPVTCQPWLASQMVSAPSPQPASSARPGESPLTSATRVAFGWPLHSASRVR